jgi:hypothetical protein
VQFVVGRNPYVRLLSGYLDKMVVDGERHDWQIMGRVNRDLGLDESEPFEATAEDFAYFVALLSLAPKRNPHFDSATNVCGINRYPYRYVHLVLYSISSAFVEATRMSA